MLKLQKCIKLRIIKPVDKTWDELGKTLHDTQYISFKAANFVIRECYLRAIAKYNGEKVEKQYYYPKLVEMFPNIAGHILNATERTASKKWVASAKDVLSSKVSLPTFKQGMPINIHNRAYKLLQVDNDYIIDVQLRSQKHVQTRYKFIVSANDRSTKIILDRIINGEYTQGEAQISNRKGKWFYIIPYQFEAKHYDIDINNIMGIDLGITKAAYWAFNNSHKRGFISGSEIEEFRRRVRNRRIEIQKQGKYCGTGRNGHGTARKLLPVDVLSEKESNFRNTCNFRYANKIVSEALRMRCATIQMEDLTGISDLSKFLKNWPYYDLQTKIINKAAEYGIRVIKVDPQYTSQRCSNCGHIEKENRPDQATFICKVCGYGDLHHCFACGNKQQESGNCLKCGEVTKHLTVNADYNAAKNLSTAGIADIIAETLHINGIEPKHKKANRKRTAKAG